ncbi:hypothetical protein Csa_010527, partial [Cucumis sativus]
MQQKDGTYDGTVKRVGRPSRSTTAGQATQTVDEQVVDIFDTKPMVADGKLLIRGSQQFAIKLYTNDAMAWTLKQQWQNQELSLC